ncbi:hypothetical protein [Alteraurantiacibacter aestuarii]|uniref:Uncharacterized protein n=1 Tax=Alteraurantiacibacter aestuarii TaxID=650004 RepID=A0A844ZLJ1_9SPHN|nr:hypothetical protein [Alteraurantiacibacter aestuarii]MXO88434.1 hypothetical protein [Alteraurantiacibacter aestuarii]
MPEGQPMLSTISPSGAWTGTAGSGFVAAPADPVRTTAKPVCRLLVPPNQYFTDELTVGVIAAANHNGSLLANLGLVKVVAHFEGASVDIMAPSFHTFADANGKPVTYFGWWVSLKKPVGVAGHANLYFEAVPKDATMQHRVMGPYQFSPQAALHDRYYTIQPSLPNDIPNGRFMDFNQLFYNMANNASLRGQNPHVQILEAGTYDLPTWMGTYQGQGYLTIEADVPVTIGRASSGLMRPRWDGIHFKGENITLDMVNIQQLYHEGSARRHWLDGITITDSAGNYYLVNKGQKISTGVRYGGIFTECDISNVQDYCNGSTLVRGCHIHDGCRDVMSDATCMVDNTITNWTSKEWREEVPALSVQYTGAGATATLALSGANDAISRTFTAKVGGVSVGTYVVVNNNPAGNYDVSDVVAWLNGLTDWTATTLDDTRRATALGKAGSAGAAFGDTDVKTAPLTLIAMFDQHSDLWQSGTSLDNIVMWGLRCWDMGTQNIYMGSASGMRDVLVANNSFHLDPTNPEATVIFHQLSGAQSHFMVAHNSSANQAMYLRVDITGSFKYNPDGYCLMSNNVFPGFVVSGTPDADLVMADNHMHGGAGIPDGATGTTTGGTAASLFADAANGDFTPAGELLTNLKVPILKIDLVGSDRGATAAAGALR